MTEKVLSAQNEILPEDSIAPVDDYNLAALKRDNFEPDEALTQHAAYYINPEQRKKLDRQIEVLYNRVAAELSNNPKDIAFALEKLKKAQNIVIEDAKQYDEALYWVAQVKKMLATKHTLRRWAYTWGLFIFFYGLAWLILFIAGFFINLSELFFGGLAGWFSALAGGIGSVVALLYNVSWQISVKQAFDRQDLMKYLIQPIMGFILGTVIFFMFNAGALATDRGDIAEPRLLAAQMLLGFVVGFHQQLFYQIIDHLLKKLSAKKQPQTKASSSRN
jgi:hypothetical protein